MKTIRNLTLGLAVVVGSVPMFAGQPFDQNHGSYAGKRVYSPVTVAPPPDANGQTGKGQTGAGQPGMAIKGTGVPKNGYSAKPAPAGTGTQKSVPDGAAKGQATE